MKILFPHATTYRNFSEQDHTDVKFQVGTSNFQVAVTGFTSCPVTVVRPGPRLRLARTGQARLHSPSQVPESAIAAVGQASLVRITSAAAQLLSPPNQSLSSGARPCFTQTNLIRDVGRRHLFRPRRRHVPVSQLQVLFALL